MCMCGEGEGRGVGERVMLDGFLLGGDDVLGVLSLLNRACEDVRGVTQRIVSLI